MSEQNTSARTERSNQHYYSGGEGRQNNIKQTFRISICRFRPRSRFFWFWITKNIWSAKRSSFL